MGYALFFVGVVHAAAAARGGGGSVAAAADAAGWWADGAAETESCLASSAVSGRYGNEGRRSSYCGIES